MDFGLSQEQRLLVETVRDFVNRRRNRRRLAEPVSRLKRLQLVRVHRVHNPVKQFAQLGIRVRVVSAL